MPIGSATSVSGPHRLNSNPGATWIETESRPIFASRAAESGESLTMFRAIGAAASTTNALMGAGLGAGAAGGADRHAVRTKSKTADASLMLYRASSYIVGNIT